MLMEEATENVIANTELDSRDNESENSDSVTDTASEETGSITNSEEVHEDLFAFGA
jgi:hypothetical protein